jgi:hypothetical protein
MKTGIVIVKLLIPKEHKTFKNPFMTRLFNDRFINCGNKFMKSIDLTRINKGILIYLSGLANLEDIRKTINRIISIGTLSINASRPFTLIVLVPDASRGISKKQ